jgi:hypothetical protein
MSPNKGVVKLKIRADLSSVTYVGRSPSTAAPTQGNLSTLAKLYGIEYVTDYRDQAGMSVKDSLEFADQPTVLSEIDERGRHQFARKII